MGEGRTSPPWAMGLPLLSSALGEGSQNHMTPPGILGPTALWRLTGVALDLALWVSSAGHHLCPSLLQGRQLGRLKCLKGSQRLVSLPAQLCFHHKHGLVCGKAVAGV